MLVSFRFLMAQVHVYVIQRAYVGEKDLACEKLYQSKAILKYKYAIAV